MTEINLPALAEETISSLDTLTSILDVPRELVASSDEIQRAWENLPRLINTIPVEYRSVHHARMCIAVASGLFDAAINYSCNQNE